MVLCSLQPRACSSVRRRGRSLESLPPGRGAGHRSAAEGSRPLPPGLLRIPQVPPGPRRHPSRVTRLTPPILRHTPRSLLSVPLCRLLCAYRSRRCGPGGVAVRPTLPLRPVGIRPSVRFETPWRGDTRPVGPRRVRRLPQVRAEARNRAGAPPTPCRPPVPGGTRPSGAHAGWPDRDGVREGVRGHCFRFSPTRLRSVKITCWQGSSPLPARSGRPVGRTGATGAAARSRG